MSELVDDMIAGMQAYRDALAVSPPRRVLRSVSWGGRRGRRSADLLSCGHWAARPGKPEGGPIYRKCPECAASEMR